MAACKIVYLCDWRTGPSLARDRRRHIRTAEITGLDGLSFCCFTCTREQLVDLASRRRESCFFITYVMTIDMQSCCIQE